jgi:myo-inositol-1(or 4)-monophosphatase
VTTARDLLRVAEDALDVSRELVLQRTLGRVRAKDDRDFVSDLDISVERAVRALLQSETPEIGFLGEEEGWSRGDRPERFWVLDPVDGTTNLVKSIPLCAVSLALVDQGRTRIGVVDAPFLALRYTAVAGEGAYHAGRRLAASSAQRLGDAVVAFGDYAVGEGAEAKNRLRLAVTEKLAATVQRVRMLGSAALDLAWVADGRLDASIILSNNPWDTAAGVLLAREAGADVVDSTGAAHTIHSETTITAPPPLVDAVVALVTAAEASTCRHYDGAS